MICESLQHENEHLKNTLLGLNDKLIVFNDLKEDLEAHKQLLNKSVTARDLLKQNLSEAALKLQD